MPSKKKKKIESRNKRVAILQGIEKQNITNPFLTIIKSTKHQNGSNVIRESTGQITEIGTKLKAAMEEKQNIVKHLETKSFSDKVNLKSCNNDAAISDRKYKELSDIEKKIKIAREAVSSDKDKIIGFNHEYIESLGVVEKLDRVDGLLSSFNRKPVIGFFGVFDAGKSTLINTIIDDDVLPAKYQPATSVISLIMHLQDRPVFLNGLVAVFSKGFQPHMINNHDLVKKYLIKQGNIDILKELAVHNYDEEKSNNAYLSIVFSSSDILKKVWLLDTPGDLDNADDKGSDTEKALAGVELVDGVLYLSTHTGFFKDADLSFASNILRQKPPAIKEAPVKHILFIQSHCHSELEPDQVSSVGRITFKRIKKQLDNIIFNSWKEDGYIDESPTPEELTARVRPFWRENDVYRRAMLASVNEMADFLKFHREIIIEKNIKKSLDVSEIIIKNAILDLEQKKIVASERTREVEKQEARFCRESAILIGKFNEIINSCSARKKNDIELMRNYFQNVTSVEQLTRLIKETYQDEKSAKKEIGHYISQLLSVRLESILKSSGKSISNETGELLKAWGNSIPSIKDAELPPNVGDLGDIPISGFNSGAAFIGGMTGLASLGAMAALVSTIGSNLGAYILVGHVAGWLTTLGLTSSVTTLTSFVAAIGGPITIGIGIAVAIGYAVYKWFSSWEESLAKSVAASIKKNDSWVKIENPINDFWDNTGKSVSAGLKELIRQSDQHIKDLKVDAAKEYDEKKLNVCIQFLKAIKAIKSTIASIFEEYLPKHSA